MTSVSTIDYDRLFLLLTMTSVSTIHLLSGNEGNSKFIITRDPTIDRGVAERKVGVRVTINLLFPEDLVNKCFIILNQPLGNH